MKYYAIYSTVNVNDAQNAQALRNAFPMDKVVIVTKNYEDAVKIATDGRPSDQKQQHAIYEIMINGRKGTRSAVFTLEDKELDILQLTPNDAKDFQLVSASLAHVNKKFKAVDLVKKAKAVVSAEETSGSEEEAEASASVEEEAEVSASVEEEAEVSASVEEEAEASADSKASKSASEEKSSAKKDEEKKTEESKAEDTKKADEKKDEDIKANSSYVIAASAAAGVGIVATGFWFGGFYPSAVALLAKAGLTIPAAVAAQVGVSIAVGIAGLLWR
ncbi:MAG TPA: hypothetical protein PLD88_07300 [Candidatus Berkiella sp.]|nr:hypothetical protein [Candidatus Berkiella sp.]